MKKNNHDQNTVIAEQTVVIGGGQKRKLVIKKPNPITALIVLILCLLIGIGAVVFIQNKSNKSGPQPADIAKGDDFSSNDQARALIKKQTGSEYSPSASTPDLSKKPFAEAYAVGVAYVQLGDSSSSYKVFKDLESKVPKNNPTLAYEFYQDYAIAASGQNNRDVAILAFEKAKEYFLQTELAKADEFYRNDEIAQIDAAIGDLKKGLN